MSSNFFIIFNNGKIYTVKNIFQITIEFIDNKRNKKREN